jgi:hypothetical protein
MDKPTSAVPQRANAAVTKVYETQLAAVEEAYKKNKIDPAFYKFLKSRLKPGVDLDDLKKEYSKPPE